MNKTLFCGVDLHSNNAVYVIADARDRQLLRKRLPNELPGVGVILGLTIMLETGDIGRFERVGDYTSYCRCVRATHSSNSKKKGSNNSRNSNAYLSWAFVEAVHHAIRHCPQAKTFYDRKVANRNGALATKAWAAKWTKAVYYMLTRQEVFDLQRVFG